MQLLSFEKIVDEKTLIGIWETIQLDGLHIHCPYFFVLIDKEHSCPGSQEQEVWCTLTSTTTYFGIIGSLEQLYI